jgi:hypothetical protein
MSNELPAPLRDYFDAVNRHDVRAMLPPFAEDALVKDEGHTHEGRGAIASWMAETVAKYNFTAEVSKATMDDGGVQVAALVCGDFPGSPVTLHYVFVLKNGKIAQLRIGQ